MGVVFRATDLVLSREVALKTLRLDRAAGTVQRQRFLREARAASRLSHPGVVRVFEAFETDELIWIAMELVQGETLHRRIQNQGGMSGDEALAIFEPLVAAIRAAHAQGVLHRDIKPSNILLDAEGQPRLMDFGLARITPLGVGDDTISYCEAGPLTAEGALLGTPAYMAPEQILGREASPRTDIYSLGAVLYEMCVGHSAIGTTGDARDIDRVLHEQPEPPSRSNPEIPLEIDTLIERCLAKDPEQRYASAGDLLEDVRLLRRRSDVAGAVTLRPLTRVTPMISWKLVSAVAAVAVLVAAAFVVPRVISRDHPLPTSRPRQVTAAPGLESTPVLSPDGNDIAFVARVNGNSEIFVVDRRGGAALQLTDSPAEDLDPAWMPDGSALVFSSDRSGTAGLWKVPRFGGSAIPLIPNATRPAISPDGKSVAFSRTEGSGFSRVWVAPIGDPSAARQLTSDGDGTWYHRNPQWSSDGARLVYHDSRNLWVVDVATGVARQVTHRDDADFQPVWAPDDRHVYFSSFREGISAIWRKDLRSGAVERVTLGTGRETSPSVSRDGKYLAYATTSYERSIEIVDRRSGRRVSIKDSRGVEEPQLAPDGSAVIYTLMGGDNRNIYLQEIDGSELRGAPRQLTDLPGNCSHPSFSPDGRWIAFHATIDGRRAVWIVSRDGGLPQKFTSEGKVNIHPEFSPDGRLLAFASDRSGSHQIWVAPVEDGRRSGPARRLTAVTETAAFPAWSPEGDRIAFLRRVGPGSELWIAPLDAKTSPRRLPLGVHPVMITWGRESGKIFAAGAWSPRRMSVAMIDPEDGRVVDDDIVAPEADDAELIDFDGSRDEELFAMWVERRNGDVWLLEAEEPGRF